MRKLAFLLFTLQPFVCFSQINIINRSLIDSSLNIAYLGVENAIELVGSKNSTTKLSFTTTNGTMSDVGQGRYILRPEKAGECIIRFQSKGQKIVSKVFRIDTTFNLITRLAGVRDSFATVQEIISNPFLIIESPKSF
jgi:hypothetical protein